MEEFEYPELATIRPPFCAAWYRKWRELHLERYPDLDETSRSNLDFLVHLAEEKEAGCFR